MPKLNPSWIPAIISFCGVLVVAGTFYGVTNYRMDQSDKNFTAINERISELEETLEEAINQNEIRTQLNGFRTELELVKEDVGELNEQVNSGTLTDWHQWRAITDARNDNQDDDIEELENRVDRLD